jgi:tRNA-dihydrouridine synthase B
MHLSTSFKIGAVSLSNRVIAAPLAGITNLPFRLLAKEAGCGLVCSEMLSANGLRYKSEKTFSLMESDPAERPLSVQLFGAEADILAEAAQKVTEAGADIVDLNFGCAVRKILKSGSGVALMRDLTKAAGILKAVRAATDVPFTIKIRSGWDPSGEQAVAIADLAQDCGVDAIAVHPRTARQGFGGQADWNLIKAIKKRLKIPVIGNGDIKCAADAMAMFETTACDAVMIGRAAIGNPWIFAQTLGLMEGKKVAPPTIDDRFNVMTRFLDASVAQFGEIHACRKMRSQLGWFTKGLPFSALFRETIKQVTSRDEARGYLDDYRERLLERLKRGFK